MDKTAEIAAGLTKRIKGTPFRLERGAHHPWDVNVFIGERCVASTDIAELRQIIAVIAARPAGDYVLVREIETVTGDFCTEPGEPFYRIEIDGFCADFDYREAADNFAAAINARIAARPAVAEDVVERVRLVVMQELWKREQYNGVTADYNAFRDTMAGRIEKYEAEAERIARAAIAAMGSDMGESR